MPRPSRRSRAAGLLAFSLAAAGCATSKQVETSPAPTAAAAGMVDVAALAPGIRIDMRYAGSDNFVGRPVPGYDAPKCYLLQAPARALARAQQQLQARGLGLLMFDCYRPVRAVQSFVAWAHDPADQANKAAFYPDIDKPKLLDGYIAETSGHSRGATIDLTLVRCDGQQCELMDMGTGHDWFGERAHTAFPGISDAQRANRKLLLDAMSAVGFVNYPMEWWHFTWQPEPTPHTAYDFPVR